MQSCSADVFQGDSTAAVEVWISGSHSADVLQDSSMVMQHFEQRIRVPDAFERHNAEMG